MPRRSLEDLDDWAHEHELRHRREAEERKLEDERLIAAVKSHVDGALKPLAVLPNKIDAIAAMNERQTEILEASAEERGRRKEREEANALKKSNEQLELERAKLEAVKKQAEDTKRIEELKQKNDRLKAIVGAAVAVLVALIGAYFAAHK